MKQLRNQTCHDLMRAAMNQMHLSARGFHRVLKLARTNADLAGAESITADSPNSLFGPRSWIPRTRKRFRSLKRHRYDSGKRSFFAKTSRLVTTQPPRQQGTKKVMEYKPLPEREEEIAKAIVEGAYIVHILVISFASL